MVAVGEREHERDHRRLEQRRDDLAEAGAPGPVGVQIDACEHQHRDEVGERDPRLALVPGPVEVEFALDRELEHERGVQRPDDADVVEREQ